MKTIQVKGTARTELGKNAIKQVRSAGNVPAVIYGHGEPSTVAVDYGSIKKALYSPDTYIVNLDIDGTTTQTVIREAQYHPVTDNILHVDFLKIVEGAKTEIELPIRLKGSSVGLLEGGKLVTLMRYLKVFGVPSELPEYVEVDITELGLGKTIRVGEIETSEKFEITSPTSSGVAMIEIPRAVRTGEEGGEELEEEGVEEETTEE